jgi:hypothetical protein
MFALQTGHEIFIVNREIQATNFKQTSPVFLHKVLHWHDGKGNQTEKDAEDTVWKFASDAIEYGVYQDTCQQFHESTDGESKDPVSKNLMHTFRSVSMVCAKRTGLLILLKQRV